MISNTSLNMFFPVKASALQHILFRMLLVLSLTIFCMQKVHAEAPPISSNEALSWLKKIAIAPRVHNYLGTFVYYADGHVESSHITHLVSENREQEKIEVLDGMPRIVYRDNDQMTCFLPESKRVYTEQRWFRKFFPDLLPQSLGDVDKSYHVTMGERERVAGHESQTVLLAPRDNLRYAHKFWIHVDSGLLLKAAVMDAEEIIEQFAFAQLEVDREISTNLVEPGDTFDEIGWQTTNLKTVVLKEGELPWQVDGAPANFKKIIEMRRNLTGKQDLVDHIALSDGLATVSIFIEPFNEHSSPLVPGFYSSRGAINIYVRSFDDHKITIVGEVPFEAIKQIGDSVFNQQLGSVAEN